MKRQDEKALVQAVHELSIGNPSEGTERLLKSLSRQLTLQAVPKYLVATKLEAQIYNMDSFEEWPGEEVKYISTDSGRYKRKNAQ